jgi:hypothetical protein
MDIVFCQVVMNPAESRTITGLEGDAPPWAGRTSDVFSMQNQLLPEHKDHRALSLAGQKASWAAMASSPLRMLWARAMATKAARFPTNRPARKYNQFMALSLYDPCDGQNRWDSGIPM